MATASAQSDCAAEVVAPANERECSVCHEPFCDPKLLRCGHLLCRHCLLMWVNSQRRAACPLCLWPILQEAEESQAAAVNSGTKRESGGGGGGGEGGGDNFQVDDSKLQALVDSFPTDLSMVALVEAKRLLGKKTHQCHVCEDVQATSLCLHCGDLLCGLCKKAHGKLTVSRHHAVEDLSALKADRLAKFQRPTPCPQHPEEACRLFCPQHATSLCLLCASSRHRGCSDVKEFEQQAEEARKVLLEVMKTLESGETDLDLALAELEQHMTQVELKTEAAFDEIRTLRDRLYKSVDDCCDRLELKTSEGRDVIREAVTLAKSILLGRKSRLGSHQTVAKRSHDSKARDVVCGMTSVLLSRVEDLELHVTLPDSAKVITMATLVVDQSAVQRVEQELARLGEVKVECAKVAANVASAKVAANTIDQVPAPVKFHARHGQFISLSIDNRTATRTQGNGCSTVIVERPMTVGELIEVQLDKWDSSLVWGWNGHMALGVVTQRPHTITVPTWSFQLHSGIIICCNEVYTYGSGQNSTLGKAIANLRVGNRAGVYLDSSHNLHLYIDGADQGVFANNIAQPCYAVFDVCDFVQQVALLPAKKLY